MLAIHYGMAAFRRAVSLPWQVIGGALFAAMVLGVVLEFSAPPPAPASWLAIELLMVIVAAAAGGLFSALSAALVLVGYQIALADAPDGSLLAWFIAAIIGTALLVGLLREDLGRSGSELETTRTLLAAANTRSERSRETEAMRAYYDPLTDLPTRRLIADRFGQIMPQARRTATYAALVLLDLNKFTEVNQNFGRETGDELLRQVGLRLTTVMRRGDTVGRLDGNKFVVLLTALTDRAGVDVAVQKLLNALAEPVSVGRPTRDLQVSATVGLAVFPDDGDDWDLLCRIADEALRVAKGVR